MSIQRVDNRIDNTRIGNVADAFLLLFGRKSLDWRSTRFVPTRIDKQHNISTRTMSVMPIWNLRKKSKQ